MTTSCRAHLSGDQDLDKRNRRPAPLCPHPATETSAMIVLVEGPADITAARRRGLPAVAISDGHVWGPECAELLAGRFVTVLMGAHPAGRAAAQRIAKDLDNVAAAVAVGDFAPGREDGYELSEWLADHSELSDGALRHLVAPTPDAPTAVRPRL